MSENNLIDSIIIDRYTKVRQNIKENVEDRHMYIQSRLMTDPVVSRLEAMQKARTEIEDTYCEVSGIMSGLEEYLEKWEKVGELEHHAGYIMKTFIHIEELINHSVAEQVAYDFEILGY